MSENNVPILIKDGILHDRGVLALLEKLGLSRNEIKCYLALLTLGPASIAEVAKAAHVHRVNAYGAVKMLVERGLLEQEMMPKGRRIHLASLEQLRVLAQEMQKRATKTRWKVEDLIPALVAQSAHTATAPSVEMGDIIFFRGEAAFATIAERTLKAPAGSAIDLLEAQDYFHSAEDSSYDQEYYIPKRQARGIRARVLHYPDEYGRYLHNHDARQNRETRFLPPDINFPCSIYIYGDEVAFVWTREHVGGVVVRGGPLVSLMRTIFEMIWKMVGKPSKQPKK